IGCADCRSPSWWIAKDACSGRRSGRASGTVRTAAPTSKTCWAAARLLRLRQLDFQAAELRRCRCPGDVIAGDKNPGRLEQSETTGAPREGDEEHRPDGNADPHRCPLDPLYAFRLLAPLRPVRAAFAHEPPPPLILRGCRLRAEISINEESPLQEIAHDPGISNPPRICRSRRTRSFCR